MESTNFCVGCVGGKSTPQSEDAGSAKRLGLAKGLWQTPWASSQVAIWRWEQGAQPHPDEMEDAYFDALAEIDRVWNGE